MSAHDDLTDERFSKASHDAWWPEPKTNFDRIAAAARVLMVADAHGLRAVEDGHQDDETKEAS